MVTALGTGSLVRPLWPAIGDRRWVTALSARWAIVLLVLCGGLVQVGLVRPTPINWDAAQFALALDRFDLHMHQPHPPGYILYVALGRALNIVIGSPPLALCLLSVLAGMAAVFMVHRLALRIFGEQGIALGAALVVLASPLVLYYGSVGLTYAPEMALGLVVAWLAWQVRQVRQAEDAKQAHAPARDRPDREAGGGVAVLAALLGVALGVAAGVRQTSLIVLLPLCVWALWGSGRTACTGTGTQTGTGSAKRTVHRAWQAFGLCLLVTCALWLIPLLAMSGGLWAYLRENLLLAQATSARTSLVGAGIAGLAHNLLFEAVSLALGLAFAAVPLALWAVRLLRFSLNSELRAFVLWWAVPPLVLYSVSHLGQYGYVLVALPPLALLSALSARVLGERLAQLARSYRGHSLPLTGEAYGLLICAGLSLLSGAYFAVAQGPTTASAIIRNDAHWQAIRAGLSNMDPGHTVLVMDVDWYGPFRLAGYLLPAYHSYAVGDDADSSGDGGVSGWRYSAFGGRSDYALPHPPPTSYLALPDGTRAVVALDETTAQMMRNAGSPLRPLPLQDGTALYVLTAEHGGELHALVVRGRLMQPVYTGGGH